MHLATSGAAVALQPNPFAAAMSKCSRPAGSIPPGMPPACDAVKIWVGKGLAAPLPIPAACPCSIAVLADQQCPCQFSGRETDTGILWAKTAKSDDLITCLTLFCSSGRVRFGVGCQMIWLPCSQAVPCGAPLGGTCTSCVGRRETDLGSAFALKRVISPTLLGLLRILHPAYWELP